MSEKEEFEITSDEARKLGDALKKEEFRRLLTEYANEISDPENRKRYEEEITQLEQERGYDVKFLNPTPGFVVKTKLKDGELKIFINIATNSEIQPATPGPLEILPNGQVGKKWSIPYSLVQAREGLDNKKQKCTIYDCIISPDTYQQAEDNPKFKEIVVITALDGIENEFGVKLERNKLKYPKLSYKGAPSASVIRKPGGQKKKHSIEQTETDPIQNLLSARPIEKPTLVRDPTFPLYTLKYRGYFDMQDYTVEPHQAKGRPKEIVISINLPKLETIKDMKLDIEDKKVVLFHESPKYELNIPLSYQVSAKDAQAKFIRDVRQLELVLPILYKPSPTLPPRQIPDTIPSEDTPQQEVTPGEEKGEDTLQLKLSEKALQTNYDCDDVTTDDNDITEKTNTEVPDDVTESIVSSNEASERKPVADELPPFQYRQTFKQFYFSFTAPDYRIDTVSTAFRSSGAEVSFETSSFCYQIEIRFQTECTINGSTSECRPGADGIVLKVDKLGGGNKLWDTFRIGCGGGKLVEKNFLTDDNILKAIGQFGDPWSEENSFIPTDIRVSKEDTPLVVELNMNPTLNRPHEDEIVIAGSTEQHTAGKDIQGDGASKEALITNVATSGSSGSKERTTLSNDLMYELND